MYLAPSFESAWEITPDVMRHVCGEVLGKGHARSGDACVLDGYCGDTEKLDNSMAEFAAYADQSTADYELFTSAVKKGRLAIVKGVD